MDELPLSQGQALKCTLNAFMEVPVRQSFEMKYQVVGLEPLGFYHENTGCRRRTP